MMYNSKSNRFYVIYYFGKSKNPGRRFGLDEIVNYIRNACSRGCVVPEGELFLYPLLRNYATEVFFLCVSREAHRTRILYPVFRISHPMSPTDHKKTKERMRYFTMMTTTVRKIESAIGYTFRDKSLLVQAFTRPSYVNEHKGANDYQLLEFLGDKYLSVALNNILFSMFAVRTENGLESTLKEGDFSAYHAALTNKQYLASRMRALGLTDCLRVSEGDKKSGTVDADSVQEDLFESIVGAIALDSGENFDVIRAFIRSALDVEEQIAAMRGKRRISAKNDLQELLQGAGYPLPRYTHEPLPDGSFRVSCFVDAFGLFAVADAPSIRKGENLVAEEMVARLSCVPILKEKAPVSNQNALSRLNEYAQKKGLRPWFETVSDTCMPDNSHVFEIALTLGNTRVTAKGKTVKEAKSAAATARPARVA